MANQKLQDLTAETAPASTDLLPITDNSTQRLRKIALSTLFAYNVKHYGALGDGSTNDTTAIQAALDAANTAGGGIVYFPKGTYMKSTALTIGSNTILQGEGKASIVRNAAAANVAVFTNKDTASGNTGIQICDLYVDGNSAASTLTYVDATSGYSAISLVRCTDTLITGCWVTGGVRTGTFPSVSSWGEGIVLIGGSRNRVHGNVCFSNQYDGIKTRSETYASIVGNHCYENGRSGIQISFAQSTHGSGFSGVEKDLTVGTLHFVCANNSIYHSTGSPNANSPVNSGIYLHTASYGTITGNQVHGTGQGFGVSGATEHNLIADNVFEIAGSASGTAIAGIDFDNSAVKYNTIQGNVIVGKSGASKNYVRDVGTQNTYRSNRFRLDGGTGTWLITVTGTQMEFTDNTVSSGGVSDSGTFNLLRLDRNTKTLTDGATITWDVLKYPSARVVLGGSRAIAIPVGRAGEEYRLELVQDSGGSRTVTWPGNVFWAGGSAPTLTTTAGRSDVIGFTSNGSQLFGSSSLNYNTGASGTTTFAGTTPGLPTGWTSRWSSINNTITEGSGYLRFAKTTAGARNAASLDAIGSAADLELLAKVRSSAKASTSTYGGLMLRGSGSAAAEDGYICSLTNSTNDGLIINRYDAGTGVTPAVTGAFSTRISWSTSTWYWIRFRAVGSTLQAKYWADGSTEPIQWDIEVFDTDLTAAGWAGVFGLSIGNLDWDSFSYSLGGTAV